MVSPDKYWCALSGLELAEEAHRRVRRFYTDLPNTVYYKRWTRAYKTFYGLSGLEDPFDISQPGIAGDQGELTSIKINHAGSIARRMIALVSQTIPEFEPIPTNSDYTSLAQVSFTKKLLAYYMDTKGVGGHLFDTAQGGGIFGQSYLSIEWDPNGGPPLEQPDPMLPNRKNAGDLSFRMFTPLDVVIDRFRYDQDHDWMITRKAVNRYDLAARYPNLADDILHLTPEKWTGMMVPTNRLDWERDYKSDIQSDEVLLYTLYHKRSDALPNGKIAMFLSADIILFEGDLPYEEVPIVPICPGKVLRTPYGDSTLHHLLAIQDVYDNLASSVASNNINFARQVVMIPNDAQYSHSELAEGMAVLGYDPGPDGKGEPKPLILTAPNAEATNFMKMLEGAMESISSISGTLRGSPPPNVQSGAFGALIAQQALEYIGAFQYSFQQAVSKTGNLIVAILKQYADQPIVAEIAGKTHQYQLKEFTKADLSQIHRVTVKSGNPAARTPAFNISAAESLLAKGVITNVPDYLTLVRTGDLDTMVEASETELLNIRRENELLAGKPLPAGFPPLVKAMVTDRHKDHIDHHASILGDPAARANDDIAEAVLAHIQEHVQHLRTADADLLMMLGQTPLGRAQPPPMQPQSSDGGAPAGMPGQQPGPDPVPPQVGGPGKLPEQPSLPINPLSGREWTPQDGAIRVA